MVIYEAKGLLTHMLTNGVFTVTCNKYHAFFTDTFRMTDGQLFFCYVDFSAAFDNVSRAFMWRKLLSQGITGKILNVVQNLYKNIKSCVAVENHKMSSFFECTKGVRQEENLSPILFSPYLNDLESFLEQNQSQGVNTDLNF